MCDMHVINMCHPYFMSNILKINTNDMIFSIKSQFGLKLMKGNIWLIQYNMKQLMRDVA